MRSTLQIAALAGAVMLCACDDPAPGTKPATATASLPEGFRYDDAPAQYGELNVGGRFIVENRTGHALDARLVFTDWGNGLGEVEGDTVELILPAQGRVRSDFVGQRARAVSMRLSGGGMLSQSQYRFEYLGARVVVTHEGSSPPHLDGAIWAPALDDQLAASPPVGVNSDIPDAPGTFLFGDFFRVVNETGVAIPLELAFKRARDDDAPAMTLPIVIAARGVQTWASAERYGWVSVANPGRPMSADTPVRSTITTGHIRLRPNHVIEYRIGDGGDRGTVLEFADLAE